MSGFIKKKNPNCDFWVYNVSNSLNVRRERCFAVINLDEKVKNKKFLTYNHFSVSFPVGYDRGLRDYAHICYGALLFVVLQIYIFFVIFNIYIVYVLYTYSYVRSCAFVNVSFCMYIATNHVDVVKLFIIYCPIISGGKAISMTRVLMMAPSLVGRWCAKVRMAPEVLQRLLGLHTHVRLRACLNKSVVGHVIAGVVAFVVVANLAPK